MKTSSTKLIAALAVAACTLTGANAMAKGGNGGNHSFSSHMNSGNISSKFNGSKLSGTTFKLNNNTINSSKHSNISTLSSKRANLSQVFKKQGNNPLSLSKNASLKKNNLPKIDKILDKKSDKKIDIFSKDKNFCKKDKGCFDWCYPWNFGCYNHCYDYCYPSYCYPTYSCSYVESVPVLAVAESTRVRVVLGSVIMLNGQSFGAQPGGVRLRVSGMALPIQVVEWTPNAVKAQLPQIELTGLTLGDIEVVRPDGSLASTTPVELTTPQPLALGR